MKVLVMGLGLHGGGLESARYLLRQGAELTVTDLRDEHTLAPSIELLEAAGKNSAQRASIRYVLGRHETSDFKMADIVIKNPAVRPDSPYLQGASCPHSRQARIETDISLFLSAIYGGALNGNVRLTAVTGTKGKSSVSSAIHWALARSGRAFLGGNITVSPLVFLDDLQEGDHVVLELSSFQLGDLRGRRRDDGKALLKPKVAVLTSIMPDHLDRYGTMEAYINDKRVIYQGQEPDDITVAQDDHWGRSFLAESKACPLMYSASRARPGPADGAQPRSGEIFEIVPAETIVQGRHQKQNLLAAGLALHGLGLPPQAIRESLGSFPGIEHRMELFHKARGIEFYNDSAATIPEAAAAAIETLAGGGKKNLVLVTGGTDKELNFLPLAQAAGLAAAQLKAIILLAGSGSEKLGALLADAHIAYLGPFDSLDRAVSAALESAVSGDRVALSPGCASFGMFLNEFDRGGKWKEAVRRLA